MRLWTDLTGSEYDQMTYSCDHNKEHDEMKDERNFFISRVAF
jgi:hypothetical protein